MSSEEKENEKENEKAIKESSRPWKKSRWNQGQHEQHREETKTLRQFINKSFSDFLN